MKHDKYWKILLSLLTIVNIWFAGIALHQLYIYIRLNANTSTSDIQWSVKEISDERYLINGKYTFLVQNDTQTGETTLTSPYFLNQWAAEQGIIENAKHSPWKVWYSSYNPEYSSLQKNFPIKECLSSLLLFGVLLYFFGLKHYVEKHHEQNRS